MKNQDKEITPVKRLYRDMVRAFWVLLHRYVGLSMAFFLIIAGLTGSLLAFYHELDTALNPDLFRVEIRDAPRLGPAALTRSVEAVYPQAFARFVSLETHPGHSVRVSVTGRTDAATGRPVELDINEVYVNPYDGAILGARDWGALRVDRAHLMPFLYKLHYTLHVPGNWGEWLFGIVALVWMFDCFVGAYLTFPRGRPFFKKWRPAWQVKTHAGAYRLNFDLHRAGGLWLWGVLFVVALSGVYFNLNQEVFRPVVSLFGTLTPFPTERLPKLAHPNHAPKLTLDEALRHARKQLPTHAADYEPRFIGYVAELGVYRVGFEERGRGERAFTLGYEQVFVDADTGAHKALWGYASGTAADKFLMWQFPLHSGQILGLPGRMLICLSGLVTAMLSITGIIVWVKKRRATVVRQRAAHQYTEGRDGSVHPSVPT